MMDNRRVFPVMTAVVNLPVTCKKLYLDQAEVSPSKTP
jgi:hypothetical protein